MTRPDQAHLHDPALLERWHQTLARTVAVDFDGTLHPYTEGWVGSTPADEPPIAGSMEGLAALKAQDYRIVVFSVRADHDEGLAGIWRWLIDYGLREFIDDVTPMKPAAFAYIDDRAVVFAGHWGPVLDAVDALAQGRAHGAAPSSGLQP